MGKNEVVFLILFLIASEASAKRFNGWQQIREYAKGVPMLNDGLVEEEEEDGSLWREEKEKVGQGGEILETSYVQPGRGKVGQEGGILETYIQPGGAKRSIMVEEEENGEEQMRNGPPSFYFEKEDKKGGEIAKRAWNSYFTGGFGKRSINTGNTGNTGKWEKAKVILRPMRSLPALPDSSGSTLTAPVLVLVDWPDINSKSKQPRFIKHRQIGIF